VANGGKAYSAPERDPLLADLAHKIPTVKKFFQKLYPGQTFYLTNLQANEVMPADLRDWADDLWLFPFYTDRKFVPYDARPGGVAAAAWSRAAEDEGGDTMQETESETASEASEATSSATVELDHGWSIKTIALGGLLTMILAGIGMWLIHALRPGRG
jgi:hypothetical protein